MNSYAIIIITAIIAYLLGTLNFAYYLAKSFSKKDITAEGSGSSGAMNTYDVTGNKFLGITVFLLDALKGYLAAKLAFWLSGGDLAIVGTAAVFVVLGHNYNAFFKFKGGRGLAASVGAFIAINPIVVLLWCLMWVSGYFIIKKNVHIANVVALVASPVLLFSSPNELIALANIFTFDMTEFKVLYTFICIIILIRHIRPLMNLIKTKNGDK